MDTKNNIPISKLSVKSLTNHSVDEVSVSKSRITIGSLDSADVSIKEEGVSPIHAVIEVTSDKVTIFDLASRSGVWVNDQKITTQALKSGDRIKIGDHEIIYQLNLIQNPNKKVPLTQQQKEIKHAVVYFDEDREVEKIFSAPKKADALEVVLAWQGTILDIQHFFEEDEVAIGESQDSNFVIPLSGQKKHVLFNSKHGNLNLPSLTSGVAHLQSSDSLVDLSQKNNQKIDFFHGDYAKLSLGEIDLYLSYTEAPPHLKRRRLFEKDGFFFKILATSVALTSLLVFQLHQLQIEKTIEIEQLPERIVTILVQPEKYANRVSPTNNSALPARLKQKVTQLTIRPSDKLPKKIPKEINVGGQSKKVKKKNITQHQAKEGSGKKAKGATGTRGTKTAPDYAEKQNQAKRKSSASGSGRGGGQSQVAGNANLEALKGVDNQIQDLLGTTLARLGKKGNQLKGFGGFDTRGSDGKALSGGGIGGGGTSDTLGGLSNKGSGGGRVGTGLGASGSGSHLIGGKTKVIIRSGGPEETVVMGSIDASAIEAAIRAHQDEFRLCYEKEINATSPGLAGTVIPSFVIGPNGRVTKAGVASSTLKNSRVEGCVVQVIRRIQFPQVKGGGIVQVKYPFRFRPVGT